MTTPVEIEKGALCKYVKDSCCALKPEEPKLIECIICLGSGSCTLTQQALSLTAGFETNLATAQMYFHAAEQAVRMLKGLWNLLEKSYPEEWKRLMEKGKQVQAGGGLI